MKKFIKMILVVLVLLLEVNVVKAASYNGYIYQAEKIDGIYFYKHRSDSGSVTYPTHNFHEQATMYRKTSDNSLVYCIENWAKLTGAANGDYSEEGIKNSSSKLTDAVLKEIELIGYYGYGYKDGSYDHTDKKWYAITQYMIWKVEAPEIETYFVDSIESKTPLNLYTKEIQEINDLVKKGELLPDFGSNEITYDKFDTIHLKDKNNVIGLKGVTITTANPSDIKINGNELIIKPKTAGGEVGNLTITRKGTRFNKNTLLYVSKDFQDAISIGNHQDLSKVYTLKQKSYNLDLNVLCEKVSGFDEAFNYIDTVCDNPNIKVQVRASHDTYNGSGDLLFRKDDVIYTTKDDYVSLYPTDYYVIPEIDLDGYFTPRQDVDLKNRPLEETEVKLVYKLQKGDIYSKKYQEIYEVKDKMINYRFIPGEGFTFGLYADEDILKGTDKTILFHKGDLIKTFITLEDGLISFPLSVPYGSYHIEEISTKPLYEKDDKQYQVIFAKEGEGYKRDITLEDIYNYLLRGKINVHVADRDTLDPLSPVDISVFTECGEEILLSKTDEEGNVLTDYLPYGNYYAKQTSSLEGYIYPEEKFLGVLDKPYINIDILNYKEPIKEEPKEEVKEEEEGGFIVDVPSTSENNYATLILLALSFLMLLGYHHVKE